MSLELSIVRSLLDEMPDAVFLKDSTGRYVYVNRTAAQFLRKTPEEMVGRSDLELYPEATAREFMAADQEVLASGVATSFQSVARSHTGLEQIYLVTKGIFRDASGTPLGVYGFSHDITERRRAEETRAK